MSEYRIQGETLNEIAYAIQEKTGLVSAMMPGAMPGYIRGIQVSAADTSGVPDDIVAEAERVSGSILGKKSSNAVTFIVMSDMHEMGDNDISDAAILERYRRANKNAGQAAKIIADRISPDFFANLGDLSWGNHSATTTADSVYSMVRARGYTADVEETCETVILPGNHDVRSAEKYLDPDVAAGLLGNYRYFDLESQKVRVICLNTADISVTQSTECISGAQLQWFAESLDLTSKAGEEIVPLTSAELNGDGCSDFFDGSPFTLGKTYLVTFNGAVYECEAKEYNWNDGSIYLGSYTIATGDPVEEDDGKYPFVILYWGDGTWEIDCPDNASSIVTFSVREKTVDISEWGIIILSHHPLDWGGISPAANCLAAYLEGGSYSVTHGGVDVSFNFSGKNSPKVIAHFHGHVHGLRVDNIHDLRTGTAVPTAVKRIAIPNACYGRSNEYGQNSGTENNGIEFGEETTYAKTDDSTGKNTAFCVVTIDLNSKIIYADCFGAGYDRIISYGESEVVTYTVTNTLSNTSTSNGAAVVVEGAAYSAVITAKSGYVLDSVTVTMGGVDITASAVSGGAVYIETVTGDISISASAVEDTSTNTSNLASIAQAIDSTDPYNGTGYKDGYRITEDSSVEFEKAADGYVITGWIPYSGSAGKAISFSGAAWDSAKEYCRMYFFDSTKRTIVAPYITGSSLSSYFSVETAGDGTTKWTPLAALSDTIAYFRMSLVGVGKDLIITIGEADSGGDASSNLIDTVGYSDNTRLSLSAGNTTEAEGYVTTGLIDLSSISGDVTIQTSGVDFRASTHEQCAVVAYNADGSFSSSDYLSGDLTGSGTAAGLWGRTLDSSGNLTLIVPSGSTKRFRLCGYGSGAVLVVAIAG